MLSTNIVFLAFITLNVFFIISLLLYDAALGSESKSSESYVVVMDGVKMKALEDSHETKWHEEIIQSISTSSDHDYASPPLITYLYTDIFQAGFSAMLTEQQLESLKGVDGFLNAFKDELLSLQTTHSPQFLGLREGRGLWSAKNLASDVIIGVVDSGIWPEHPSFDDSELMTSVPSRWKGTTCQTGTNFIAASNCNKKLIGAAAFFKGYESMYGKINETSEYRSARDSNGHGTHIASTAGGTFVRGANFFDWANGTAAGMRPTARIAAYKVCHGLGPSRYCASSDVLAAMEQAVKDGVDVLSLSLSWAPGPYYNDPVAIGAFHAMRNGVIVSGSAGNSGPNSSTVKNGAPWLMTVAASTTDRSFQAQVRLGNGRIFKGTTLCSGKSTTKSLPTVHDETSMNSTLCVLGSLSQKLVKGKIVICVRGDISLVEKADAVKAAGGDGMILADREGYGELSFDFAFEVGIVLPAILLGISEANAVIRYTKSPLTSNPTATIEFQDAFRNRAPVMASFSSRGPNPVDLNILKPDVTAPGVNILAAWPPNVSPTETKSDKPVWYNIITGTSMSCPHVSGIMALLKSLHPHWSPAAIKSAIMTTAYVYDSENKPISDGAASSSVSNGSKSANPFVFGSGHVNPNRAAYPGLIYDVSARDYLNYLCSLGYNSTQMALFVGKENKATNCSPGSHIRPGDLNYPSFSLVFNKKLRGTTSYMRTVTNVGIGGVSNYFVKVNAPKGVSIVVRPTVLKFGKMGEKLSYNVTFKAIKGKVENFTFGYLEWVSSCDRKYSVRSPVAVTWIE